MNQGVKMQRNHPQDCSSKQQSYWDRWSHVVDSAAFISRAPNDLSVRACLMNSPTPDHRLFVFVISLVKARGVGFLDQPPAARPEVVVKSRPGPGESEIERRIFLFPLLEGLSCIFSSALDLDVLVEPLIAV